MAAALPANTGDINGDGKRDVVDISCYISAALATLGGEPSPSCQLLSSADADLVCDGVLNVLDAQRSALVVLYVLSEDPSIAELLLVQDPDLDLLQDGCDEDDDGDGFDDACELALGTDPLSFASAPSDPMACSPCDASSCSIAGACVPSGAKPPGNPCLTCSPMQNPLSWTPINGIPCDDGSYCTLADQCQNGSCHGPITVSCDDLNPCTIDACDAIAGCIFTPTTGPCSDGNACTTGETCSVAGFCGGGTATVCNDGNPCTGDGCKIATGCFFAPMPLPCDDGNVCTPSSLCSNGACVGQGAIDCSDGNPCTLDQCHPTQGCTWVPTNGAPCVDGDACTIAEHCNGSSCQGMINESLFVCDSTETIACSLFGNAGAELDCVLGIASANAQQALATAAQFTLDYDPKVLELVNFFDELCFVGAGCFLFPMSGPGSLPMSTGHSVSAAPQNIADWKGILCSAVKPCPSGLACTGGLCAGTDGFGGVVIINTNDPTAVLSPAYLVDSDTVQGNPNFLIARFKLLQSRSIFAPAEVVAGGMKASDSNSQNLEMVLHNGIFTTYEAE